MNIFSAILIVAALSAVGCDGDSGTSPLPATPTSAGTNPSGGSQDNPDNGGNSGTETATCGELKEGEVATRTRYKTNWATIDADCQSETQTATCKGGALSFDGSFTADSCVSLASFCSSGSRAQAWAKYSDSSIEGDDGSATHPYKICNKSQLLHLGRACGGTLDDGGACGKSFLLMANIDLTGEAIGADEMIGHPSKAYSGTFDGNGLKISGISIDLASIIPPVKGVGLFSRTDGPGGIRNLSVDGSVKGIEYVGLLVGQSGAPLSNVLSSGSVSAKSSYDVINGLPYYADRVGGLAGHHSGYTVTSATSSATVEATLGTVMYSSSTRRTGGLIGYSSATTILKSTFSGTVYGSTSVGGIVGVTSNTNFNDVSVSGTIYGLTNVGGIAGETSNIGVTDVSSFNTVIKARFTGSIHPEPKFSPNSVSPGGGIIGLASQTNITDAKNSSHINITAGGPLGGIVGQMTYGIVKDAENSGNIQGTAVLGGIAGKADQVKFENILSSGTITASWEKAGGVVAEFPSGLGIINAYVTGDVTGARKVGGLFGEGWTRVAASRVEADITGTTTFVGGLGGYNSCSNCGSQIEQSYFIGSVTSAGDFVGGLYGALQGAAMRDVYAMASVTGANYVGGLVGACYATIRDSYFKGTLSAGASMVGVLLGEHGSGCNVVNGYYPSANVTSTTPTNTYGAVTDKATLLNSANANWDLLDVWNINASQNDGWPTLQYFNP